MSDYSREPPNMQKMGPTSYKRRIKEQASTQLKSGNLQYSFGKPTKKVVRNTVAKCTECGYECRVSDKTIAVICSNCKELFKVTKENSFRVIEKDSSINVNIS